MNVFSAPRRDLSVDLARGVAVLSMYVAHVAPSAGPLELLNLSEFLTAALFATLVGVGAELAAARHGLADSVKAAVVRAGVLIVLGQTLSILGAQVYLVLTHLGVLTLVMTFVARASSRVVAAIGLVFAVGAPILMHALQGTLNSLLTQGNQPGYEVVGILAAGDPYRVTTMIAWGCLGVLLIRYRARLTELAVPLVLILGVAAAVLLELKRKQVITFVPYDGGHLELVLNAMLCAIVLLAAFRWTPALPKALTVPTAGMGQMALTLYVLQVAFLGAWVGSLGHVTDDSWLVLAVLIAGSVAFWALWRLIGRGTRGPIEAVVDYGVRLVNTPK